jgi:hypothetical protein
MSTEQRILFICGSMNQTTQMHQISRHLNDYQQAFTPFYCDGMLETMRRLKRLEFTIIGAKLAHRCHQYLSASDLAIDYQGRRGPYDLVVTCSDVFLQKNIRGNRIVLVQEGTPIRRPRPSASCSGTVPPLWIAGTAATGLSDTRAFCVASDGYRDLFTRKGAKAEKIVVTGIPNFDHCERYRDNSFPHRHYVLVCTSPLREIFRGEDRPSFIRQAIALANGRPMIFKFHPNEDLVRAEKEVRQYAPGARTFKDGSAEEMIANCDVLITQYSSTAFVGLALGKRPIRTFPAEELRSLAAGAEQPAAANIAEVCWQSSPIGDPVNDGSPSGR